jgi:hypothetical protein
MSEPDWLKPCAASLLRERIGRNGDCEIEKARMPAYARVDRGSRRSLARFLA